MIFLFFWQALRLPVTIDSQEARQGVWGPDELLCSLALFTWKALLGLADSSGASLPCPLCSPSWAGSLGADCRWRCPPRGTALTGGLYATLPHQGLVLLIEHYLAVLSVKTINNWFLKPHAVAGAIFPNKVWSFECHAYAALAVPKGC